MIWRETAISIIINVVISAGVFLALFGIDEPTVVPGPGNFAFDFLPQAFMVALMASLVPGLLTASRIKTQQRLVFLRIQGRLAILVRALVVGVAAALVLGGAAAAAVLLAGVLTLSATAALCLKMLFGGLLALAVTPSGVRFALRARPRPTAAVR